MLKKSDHVRFELEYTPGVRFVQDVSYAFHLQHDPFSWILRGHTVCPEKYQPLGSKRLKTFNQVRSLIIDQLGDLPIDDALRPCSR